MRRIELAGRRAFLSPSLYELAVLIKLHNTRVGVAAMSISDEDIAVWCGDHIGRLIEGIRAVAGNPGFSKREEDLALVAELDHDVPLPRGFWIICAARRNAVGHPNVPFLVYVNAVRKNEHAGAEAFDQVPVFVKLEDHWKG